MLLNVLQPSKTSAKVKSRKINSILFYKTLKLHCQRVRAVHSEMEGLFTFRTFLMGLNANNTEQEQSRQKFCKN